VTEVVCLQNRMEFVGVIAKNKAVKVFDSHCTINQSINQSIKVFLEWPLSGTATARSTAGVNVSNKSQETIDRINVFSAFSGRLAATQRR